RPATQRANNVFADRNGSIARKVDGGWEQRSNGQWSRENAVSAAGNNRDAIGSMQSSRPSTSQVGSNRTGSSNFNRSSFERAHQARNRGASREMRRPVRTGGRRR
ncbi:MAG: carbohydrate-binding family V/XII, partial [Pseudomonadota bacterium]